MNENDFEMTVIISVDSEYATSMPAKNIHV